MTAMPRYLEFNAPAVVLLDHYAAARAGFFAPWMRGLGDFQPGLGVLVFLGVLAWGAFSGRLQARLQFLVVVLLAISFLPVPGVSRLWVGYFPEAFAALTNFPLNFRLLPSMVAFTCGGAFSWLALQAGPRRWATLVLLAGLTAWSVAQVPTYVTGAGGRTSTRAVTNDRMRSENSALARYAYDLLPAPNYYSHGKSDPRLESRIFDERRRLVVGPNEIAVTMEQAQAESFLLTSTVEPTGPTWLNLHPELTLAPGAHVLLRFEFLEKNYEGFLIIRSEHGYREYQLPESGGFKAFGVKRGRANVISLWNSGTTIEHVRLLFQRGGAGATGEFGDFARLTVSPYIPERSPVHLRGLIPYRVEVDMPVAGWLESPRVSIPGYAAKVDGQPVPIRASIDSLVTIPVPAGRHEVELAFRGSVRLWLGWWVSVAAWLALLAGGRLKKLARG